MRNVFCVAVLLVICIGSSLLTGCAKDPVIPTEDIPAIPPSTRSAPGGGGPGAGAPGVSGEAGTGGASAFPTAPAN